MLPSGNEEGRWVTVWLSPSSSHSHWLCMLEEALAAQGWSLPCAHLPSHLSPVFPPQCSPGHRSESTTGGFRESPCLCLRAAHACAHKSHSGLFSSLLLTLTRTSPGFPHGESIGGFRECFSTSVRSRNFKGLEIWKHFGKTAPMLLFQSHDEIDSWIGESSKGPTDILQLFFP